MSGKRNFINKVIKRNKRICKKYTHITAKITTGRGYEFKEVSL